MHKETHVQSYNQQGYLNVNGVYITFMNIHVKSSN